MTLLEVLLAVLLMSFAAAAIMRAISSIATMESNGRKRLQAFEIANRLILQFLDDEDAMPGQGLPLDYGNNRFFWDLDKTPCRMVINKKQEFGGANLQALDRYLLIGVTVYETRTEGNFEVKGEPIAFLSRVIDPAAPRNPDTLETFGTNMDKITKLVGVITQGKSGATSGSKLQGRQLK
jgi:type II secretory pathway pseudopilin PulG